MSEDEKPQSFAKSLFAARIPEELVFPYPKFSEEESGTLKLILESVRKFAADRVDSAHIDRQARIPTEVIEGMKELGLFGLQIPQEYGGLGLSQLAYARVFEEIGSIDASLACTMGAHSSIGMKALLIAGSKEQKEKYLPKLASGEMLAAFALTEPGAGSDAYSIKTRAERQADGNYVINGNKIWITNGGIADFFTVFAKTSVGSGEKSQEKVTAFIVTRDMPGFSTGKEEHKLGIRGSSTTEVSLQNVRVPAENVLGELGKGFKLAMEVLNSGRLSLGTGSVGGAKTIHRLALAHATQRKQFGKPISDFGLIKEKLGRMAMEIYVTESMAYLTCGLVDSGVEDYSVESAVSKISGSEMVWFVAHEAMQVAGGTSYMQEYPFERLLRDARINLIFEGTNEILRLFIALSGMKGVGEYLKMVGKALNDPIKSLGVLYDFFVSQRIQRSFAGDRITKAHPRLKREASIIEEQVGEFATAVERVITKYRSEIWEKQFVQKRISEMAMDLCRMTAVVSRTSSLLNERGESDALIPISLTEAYCSEAERRIRYNLRSMDRNVDELLKDLSVKSCEAGMYPAPFFE